MADESELEEKLERWLSQQTNRVTLFDVLATGNGELIAAYILKAFRAPAGEAVLDQLEREAGYIGPDRPIPNGETLLRVFEGIARAWNLREQERLSLLGLDKLEQYRALESAPLPEVPVDILERLAILLDIFHALNTLLPEPAAADAWIRKPNNAPRFQGSPALAVMTSRGIEGLREVRALLQAEIWAR
jgi:hypothetical protein